MAWLTPGTINAAQRGFPLSQMQAAAEPFVWGGGGRRLTPKDVASEQQIAQALMAEGSDYSPIGHWTQGLARLSQGIMGGLRARDARRAGEANRAEADAVGQSIVQGGGDQNSVLAALLNPYVDDGTKKLALSIYESNAKSAQGREPTNDESLLMAAGLVPGTPEYQRAALDLVQRKSDPFVATSLPDGGLYAGPVSGIGSALGGGGQSSTAPGGGMSAPDVLPPDFDFGGPTPPASGSFRQPR